MKIDWLWRVIRKYMKKKEKKDRRDIRMERRKKDLFYFILYL